MVNDYRRDRPAPRDLAGPALGLEKKNRLCYIWHEFSGKDTP